MPTTYELLYISTITPDTPVTEVARIAARARQRNAENHITGLLVFDGQRFCQHIEGDKAEVRTLFRRIREDPRHTEVEVQYQGLTADRRFPRFSIGYAPVDGEDLMERIARAVGEQAVLTLLAALPQLDLDT